MPWDHDFVDGGRCRAVIGLSVSPPPEGLPRTLNRKESYDASGPTLLCVQQSVDPVRAAALVYAGLLILGALGAVAVSVYNQLGSFVGFNVVLLMGAVVFFGAQRQGQGSSGNPGGGATAARPGRPGVDGSFRRFALALTGASVGIALAMFALIEVSRLQHPTGFPFLPAGVFLLGCLLAFLGAALLVVDAVYFHRTGRRF